MSSAPDPLHSFAPPDDDVPVKTAGQKACIALAVLALLGGSVMLVIASCQYRRPLPAVRPLPPAPSAITRPAEVPVLLSRSKAQHAVGAPAGGVIYAAAEGTRRIAALGEGPWQVSAKDGRLWLDAVQQPETELELVANDGRVSLDGRAYRGSLSVKLRADGKLAVRNVLPPEDYLRSVVGSEMYSRWPLEALMAQAVAARTYMLYALEAQGHLTLVDLAYKGIEAESPSAEVATELTEGIVLTYAGRVLPAYFHSTCGGGTTRVDKVFAEEPIEPLRGVPCEWCRSSPWYEWKADLDGEAIAQALKERDVRHVLSVQPEGTEPDGYAQFVNVNGQLRLGANAFRLAVGAAVLRSTRFQVEVRGGRFVFTGRGYGHGVGLCQWGACGLAEAGRTWEEILLHYYPGALIEKAY